MSDELKCTTEDRVTTITLNRPDRGNRVTNEMVVELARLLANVDPACQVIILRGNGDDFCLGRDVMGGEPKLEAYDLRNLNEVVFACYGAFRNSPVPTVGVVKGKAHGFGCALAAICDITLATPESRFALPEMGHNIMPTMAMSSLVDRVARKGALYLTYSTEEVDAETAPGLRPDQSCHFGVGNRGRNNPPCEDHAGRASTCQSCRQGIRTARFQHGHFRIHRFRTKSSRHDQFVVEGEEVIPGWSASHLLRHC